jgi:TP901 family phage tail tape measure protein
MVHPVSQVTHTAEMFAREGLGVQGTLQRTNAALVGQAGMGMDPERSTQMFLTIDHLYKGLVTTTDMLDRIAKLSSEFPAAPEELSNAVERAGPLASRLQHKSVGGKDAIDMVLAASATIMSQTQVSGDQAGVSLRMIMSRLLRPTTASTLQKEYGIKLGASNPDELRPIVDILGEVAKNLQGPNR